MGVDVSTYPDLDPSGRNIDDARAIAETVVRRLMTEQGTLSYVEDEDSIDLRSYLSGGVDREQIDMLANRIEGIAELDDRVRSAEASLVLDDGGEKLRLTLVLTHESDASKIKLNIEVTAIALTLLDTVEA